MTKTLHSKLPVTIDPYEYMFGDIKVHGFAIMAGDEETMVATIETDNEIEVGSDQAIDNYLQTKADAQLIQKAVNNFYPMVNLLRKIRDMDRTLGVEHYQALSREIAFELVSLLNQLDVSDPNHPGQTGDIGANSSAGDISTLPGI